MEHETLATELLREVKAQSRRWFWAFLIALLLWFATIGVFIWYISLPIEEYEITQETSYGEGNIQVVGSNIGGSYGQTDSEVQEAPE